MVKRHAIHPYTDIIKTYSIPVILCRSNKTTVYTSREKRGNLIPQFVYTYILCSVQKFLLININMGTVICIIRVPFFHFILFLLRCNKKQQRQLSWNIMWENMCIIYKRTVCVQTYNMYVPNKRWSDKVCMYTCDDTVKDYLLKKIFFKKAEKETIHPTVFRTYNIVLLKLKGANKKHFRSN